MRSDMLRAHYKEKFGVELLIPNAEDATSTDRIIFDELVRGEVCPPSREAYLAIIAKLRAQGAQGVILGCTEIFMLIGQDDLPGFPVFDTTRLHVEALVAFAAGTA